MNTRQKPVAPAAAAILFLAVAANGLALGRLALGVKGGLNMANIRVETETTIRTNGTLNRFAWGGFIGYKLSEIVSLQLEVLDFPKGTEVPVTSEGAFATASLRYDYTEVPLLVKFSERSRSRLTPSVFAGPYIAFLRKAESSIAGAGDAAVEPIQDRRNTDFGLTFGASFAYKLAGPVDLLGEIRYDFGLTNVDKTPGSTFNHRVISILFGVTI